MHVTGVQEQLRLVGGVYEGSCSIEITPAREFRVSVHPMDLDWHTLGPSIAKLGDRETGIEEERSRGPRPVWANFWAGITPIEIRCRPVQVPEPRPR